MATLILTIIGDDRPGIVDSLSGVIEAHDGNWEQSRMAHLANKFAGVLKISVADKRAEGLTKALQMLDGDGALRLSIERGGGPDLATSRSMSLQLVGQDHPGIVHDIAHALAECEVSIEELASDTESGSMSGGTLFRASLRIRVPDAIAEDQLRAILEGLANELMVDLTLD